MNGILLLGVAAAGGVGAALRLTVDTLVSRRTRWPIGTLIINVSGSAALGVLTGLGAGMVGSAWFAVLGTGLLGGYTTFSTAAVEAVRLWSEGRRGWAGVSSIVMTAAAIAAAGGAMACGLWIGSA